MNFARPAACVTTFALLTACGGSSEPLSFLSLAETGAGLAEEVATIPYTDPSTLPTSDSATYGGAMLLDVVELGTAVGQMTLTANFKNSTVSGNVRNIFTADEEAMSGSLDIANSPIDRTADIVNFYTYEASLTGELTDSNGIYDVDATMLGDFTGTDHRYVEGIVVGGVEFEGEDYDILNGEFYGER